MPAAPSQEPALLVAIIGKANVGKSTLFNKLLGRNQAIVSNVPGTTRDRAYHRAEWGNLQVDLVDTGGLLGEGEGDPLQGRVEEQALVAAAEADVVLFLTDIKTGIEPADQRVAHLLKLHQRKRRSQDRPALPVFVLVNKCDNPERKEEAHALFSKLGFGPPLPCSAIHGSGIHEIWDTIRPFQESFLERVSFNDDLPASAPAPAPAIAPPAAAEQPPSAGLERGDPSSARLDDDADIAFDDEVWGKMLAYEANPDRVDAEETEPLAPAGVEPGDPPAPTVRLALIGRPNSGKSTLLNKLIGESRALVSDIPGTTIDPVDASFMWNETRLHLTDTAGIRRRSQQKMGIERAMCLWSERALQRSDIGILVVDAVEGLQTQDVRLLDLSAHQMLRGTIIAFNKWDAELLRHPTMTPSRFEEAARAQIPAFSHIPIHFICAETGRGLPGLLKECADIVANRALRFTTRHLMKVFRQVESLHAPAGSGGAGNRRSQTRRPKIRFVTQASSRGIPTFAFFVNDKSLVTPPYERFMEQTIRKYLHPFRGCPLQLVFRSSSHTDK
jgi:GTP-binding protein